MTNDFLLDLNDLDHPTRERVRKRFTTLQARAAIVGVELAKKVFEDEAAVYVLRQGAFECDLASHDDLEAILLEMGA